MKKKAKKTVKRSKPARKPAKKAVKKAARKAAPKKSKKAPAKKKAKRAKPSAKKPALSVVPPPNSVLLGRVEDFYAHISVIALTLKKAVRVGDRLHILGHTTNIQQTLDSMQINHQAVTEANAEDGIGIKANGRCRRGDYVFLITG